MVNVDFWLLVQPEILEERLEYPAELAKLMAKDPTCLKEPTLVMLLMMTVRLLVEAATDIKMLGEEMVQPVHEAEVMISSLGTVIFNWPAGVPAGKVIEIVMEMGALLT